MTDPISPRSSFDSFKNPAKLDSNFRRTASKYFNNPNKETSKATIDSFVKISGAKGLAQAYVKGTALHIFNKESSPEKRHERRSSAVNRFYL